MIDWREIKSICTLKISKIIIYNDILYYYSEPVDCLIIKNHVADPFLSAFELKGDKEEGGDEIQDD